MDAMALVARRTGLSKKQFFSIFERFLPDYHDSLWIDMTSGSKHKLRKNGFQVIKVKK